MLVKSKIRKNDYYDEDEMVFFRNCVQSACYIKWGCKLVDLFVDDNNRIVFVFTKEEHKNVVKKWLEQKENIFQKLKQDKLNRKTVANDDSSVENDGEESAECR